MLLLMAATMMARAQEARPVEPGDFVVEIGSTTATVRQLGVPFGASLRNPDRVCRVGVFARDGKAVPEVASDCHAGLSWAVDDVLPMFEVELEHPPSRDLRLFEVWYVFPNRKGGDVQVYVRQDWNAELTLRPKWLGLLEYQVRGLLPPRYPEAALDVDTQITTCDVDLDVGNEGTLSRATVRRCDEVFHDEALRAAKGSLVLGELEDVSLVTGLTFGVRFERDRDGKSGRAYLELPGEPDVGDRARSENVLAVAPPPVRAAPTTDPLFVVDHRSYAEVGVYDVVWPEGLEGSRDRTCEVLFQVNSAQQVWVWPERCDDVVRDRVVKSARQWYLAHGDIERGERFARFRGTFHFPADGSAVSLLLPADDLKTKPDDLPEHVGTFRPAKALVRVPPKMPRDFTAPPSREGVECQFRVEISRRGKPAEITLLTCPGDYVAAASKAISKWRWQPALANGEALASSTQVRVRFGGVP